MGLTIHYDLSLPSRTPWPKAKGLVEQLRQRCLDLPFKEVGELRELNGQQCEYEQYRGKPEHESLMWFLIQANRGDNPPESIVGFDTWPGDGCEAANVGLSIYPKGGKLSGLKWNSFCKTQYANDPRCGGLANFLRCHLCVVAMLDAAIEVGFKVKVTDEAHYWKNRDIAKLTKEIGEWDKLIAGGLAAFQGAFGSVASPMLGRPDFERLEHEALKSHPEIGKLDLSKLAELTGIVPGGIAKHPK